MKTYKIKITFNDGTYKYIYANKDKIVAQGNVIKYVFNKYNKNSISEIKTRSWNDMGKNYYWDLNYDTFFERALNNHYRVEATNASGHEDITGYGSRTDGKKNRFYIGRSTGWIPIYLEILQDNSNGGSSLYIPNNKKNRTFKIV